MPVNLYGVMNNELDTNWPMIRETVNKDKLVFEMLGQQVFKFKAALIIIPRNSKTGQIWEVLQLLQRIPWEDINSMC